MMKVKKFSDKGIIWSEEPDNTILTDSKEGILSQEEIDLMFRMANSIRESEVTPLQQAIHQKNRDQLTGFFSQSYHGELFNSLSVRLLELIQGGGQYSVVFIDLDNLKLVNDNHGHDKGNNYICSTVEKANSYFNFKKIMQFRLGGDEFVFIIEDEEESAVQKAIQLFQEDMKKIESDLLGPNSTIGLGSSIGFANSQEEFENSGNFLSYEDLKTLADCRMYREKFQKRKDLPIVQRMKQAILSSREVDLSTYTVEQIEKTLEELRSILVSEAMKRSSPDR